MSEVSELIFQAQRPKTQSLK